MLCRLVVASSTLLVSSFVVGCAGVTPTGGRLPAQQVPKAEVIEQHAAVSTPMVSTAELQAAYVAAGSPTIGFIRDSYQLPVANPLGAARIIEGNAFGMPYQQSLTVPSTYRPFAIQPMDNGFAVQQLALPQQDLTAGVRFVEVTTADANRIVDAEKKAAEENGKV